MCRHAQKIEHAEALYQALALGGCVGGWLDGWKEG